MIRDACLVVYRFQLLEILSRYTVDMSFPAKYSVLVLEWLLPSPPLARIWLRSVSQAFRESLPL